MGAKIWFPGARSSTSESWFDPCETARLRTEGRQLRSLAATHQPFGTCRCRRLFAFRPQRGRTPIARGGSPWKPDAQHFEEPQRGDRPGVMGACRRPVVLRAVVPSPSVVRLQAPTGPYAYSQGRKPLETRAFRPQRGRSRIARGGSPWKPGARHPEEPQRGDRPRGHGCVFASGGSSRRRAVAFGCSPSGPNGAVRVQPGTQAPGKGVRRRT